MPNLLATKLHQPAIPLRRVVRARLVAALNAGVKVGRQITLVSAPPGFGKTTCINEWLHSLDLPVAWLSLDAADDDPGRFFAYLLAALQKVEPDLGRGIESVLSAGQVPPGEVIATALINDLLHTNRRFLLVLDDFQVIQEHSILHAMETLLANLPPVLHVVLITREDPSMPLARLRANNQLTEIRAADLRFSIDEARQFLNQTLELHLTETDAAALESRTEGWIAGLQLAGLSVQNRANPSGYIASIRGSHRHILSYLTEEVLDRQPEEIQQFLLRTAILERLSGDLCDAVSGRTDSRTLLEQLYHANLFLVPLDDEQQWYRYHHLFADLLRDRLVALPKESVPELHRRASQWYAGAGQPFEAIQHALAAEDYPLTVRLLEDHALELLVQGYSQNVSAWLQAIPAEWHNQSKRANLIFAWMYVMRGAIPQAYAVVERLHTMFAQSAPNDDASAWALWLGLQAMLQPDSTESLKLARQALELAPAAASFERSLINMALAGAYQRLDDYSHTIEALQMLVQHAQAANNPISEMLGIAGLIQITGQHGQLRLASQFATQGLERVQRSGSLAPISAAVYGVLGMVAYLHNQVDAANDYFERATQVSSLSGISDAELSHGIFRSRLLQCQGKLAEAVTELQKTEARMQAAPPLWMGDEVTIQQVRLHLASGQTTAAEMCLIRKGFEQAGNFSIPDFTPEQPMPHAQRVLYNCALRILLAEGSAASLHRGVEAATLLIDSALQRQYLQDALEALLLRAQIHAALGSSTSSLADIARAVELAEPEGYIRPFLEEGPAIRTGLETVLKQRRLPKSQLEYVRQLVAAFLPTPPASADALVEPLTTRELDVLRLIADGLKYEEIAGQLVISVNTVRSHVKVLYGKLGVNNRTQAISTAQQHHLL